MTDPCIGRYRVFRQSPPPRGRRARFAVWRMWQKRDRAFIARGPVTLVDLSKILKEVWHDGPEPAEAFQKRVNAWMEEMRVWRRLAPHRGRDSRGRRKAKRPTEPEKPVRREGLRALMYSDFPMYAKVPLKEREPLHPGVDPLMFAIWTHDVEESRGLKR